MKLTTSTLAIVVAYSAAVGAAPTNLETSVEKRNDHTQLTEALRDLQTFNNKRDTISSQLDKREYEIVTKVLAALDDTQMSPKVIHYLATNEKLQPIVIKTLVAAIKAGSANLTAIFKALDESNLIVTVVNDLISDCSFYVSLFDIAKKIIAGLEQKVESLIKEGISKISQRDLEVIQYQKRAASQAAALETDFDKRGLDDVVVNLLNSLGQSGLATSVVKSIITDSSYIPFAVELMKEILASGALSLSQLVTALKESNLVGDLLKQILTVDTFKTVAVNAFAAFFGDCPSATSVITAPSGYTSTPGTGSGSSSGSNSGSGNSAAVNPCKKKRRRRRSYDY